MVHVASEMERLKFDLPLLIGGATTSRKHTAVKIAPAYGKPTIHVADASRSVTVVGDLVNERGRAALVQKNREEQESIRREFEESARKLVPYGEAKARAWVGDQAPAAVPDFLGIRILDPVPLEDILPYIDWTPFFHAWELRGIYPDILERPGIGEAARDLFENARKLLDDIVAGKRLVARAAYGFFPAGREGDDIIIYEDAARTRERARFHTLRQQQEKRDSLPYFALADFVGPGDYLGAFVVSAGFGSDELAKRYEADRDDYHSIMVKALADRLAEALAEKIHEQARRDCGFGKEEKLSKEDLLRERYRGIRPAPGYPALPDHSEKATLFDLLDATANIGVELTESYAMLPAASVSGLYLNHPDAQYFSVGKIGRDQVEDYARRKGLEVQAVERWLRPNLGY
jgi:5-methyltetrahydrofolate--homocysteine methyltransferase